MKKAAVPSFLIAVILLAGAVLARAQKMERIGYISPLSGPRATLETFKEELRELGWVEEKNIKFEYRYAGGQLEKLPDLATELVSLKVDVIVAGPGNSSANAAKRATTTIPIVMVGFSDPVGLGLVASLARPGANVTGLTLDVTPEQAGKILELLKEAVPKVSRVAILRRPTVSIHVPYSKEAERAAKKFGVTIQFADMQARNENALQDALDTVVHQRAHALLALPHLFFTDRRQQILDFAAI